MKPSSLFFSTLIFFGVLVSTVHGQTPLFPDIQGTDLIESLLKLELETQKAQFVNVRKISSQNLDSVPALWITAQGFTLVQADQIEAAKKTWIVEYLVVRWIKYSEGGTVTIRLSRVEEGRPCFSEPFSRQQSVTYRFVN